MQKILLILCLLPSFLTAQEKNINVTEIDNSIFKKDKYWRGADGAATIELGQGKILWLFSDTFIDQDGTGKRVNSNHLIRNSIAIQDSASLHADLTFWYGGTKQQPDDFFELPGNNWFWTGHGIVTKGKLVIFLFEVTAVESGMGFESTAWHIAVIDNPSDPPDKWAINYHKAPDTYGVVVGSSAVLQDENHIYAFGVKEPGTHETYLLRFEKEKLLKGDFSKTEWWIDNKWTDKITEEPKSSSLFTGQTEFSVHYDPESEKYVQIQTYGFGSASIGYRLADRLCGPWSEPVIFHTPPLKEEKEYVYTANAHPEFKSDELIITYNINNFDFERLVNDEEIYFPKIIKISLNNNN